MSAQIQLADLYLETREKCVELLDENLKLQALATVQSRELKKNAETIAALKAKLPPTDPLAEQAAVGTQGGEA